MIKNLPVELDYYLAGKGITGPSDVISGGAGFFMASFGQGSALHGVAINNPSYYKENDPNRAGVQQQARRSFYGHYVNVGAGRLVTPSNALSAVDVFSMADIKDRNLLYRVVNFIDYPVIANPHPIIAAVNKLFTAGGAGISGKPEYNIEKSVLKVFVGFMKEFFSGFFNLNRVAHFFRFLRISSTTSSKGLNFPLRRFLAIARSIISSLSSLIARTLEMNISRASGASALNFEKNLFAVFDGVILNYSCAGNNSTSLCFKSRIWG